MKRDSHLEHRSSWINFKYFVIDGNLIYFSSVAQNFRKLDEYE